MKRMNGFPWVDRRYRSLSDIKDLEGIIATTTTTTTGKHSIQIVEDFKSKCSSACLKQ